MCISYTSDGALTNKSSPPRNYNPNNRVGRRRPLPLFLFPHNQHSRPPTARLGCVFSSQNDTYIPYVFNLYTTAAAPNIHTHTFIHTHTYHLPNDTAGNDASIKLWDLSRVHPTTGVPKAVASLDVRIQYVIYIIYMCIFIINMYI